MTHTRLFETRGRCLDTYRITEMAAHLLFKLGQFRENGEFIDVRLKVDESIFPAHRNVLAAVLSRDDLIAPSETFVFKSVMQWIKHQEGGEDASRSQSYRSRTFDWGWSTPRMWLKN